MSTLHLDHLLDPRSIALIGASDREDSAGRVVAANLIEGGYEGAVYFINPRYRTVLGAPCHRSLKQLDDTPDLVVFIAPERIVRRTLLQCYRRGVRVMMVMSAVRDDVALRELAGALGIRLIGPYCAGLIRPFLSLNISYATHRIQPGPLAIVTQSASLAAAILDWADASGVGFSALLAAGEGTDISLADLLDLLSEDTHTRAIIVYLDRVSNTRVFLSAISALARVKPVVLMKSTHSAAPWCDALLHTGQVHDSNPVFDAAMTRAGVVHIKSFGNLFAAARTLSLDMRISGRRLAILGNGAAPAMLACERIEAKGFDLPRPSRSLQRLLASSHGGSDGEINGHNPWVLRQPGQLAERYRDLLTALANSGEFDAIVVIHVPDARNDPQVVAEAVIRALPLPVPLLTCWMGESRVQAARAALTRARLATFRTPEAATDGFDFLFRHHRSHQQLQQLAGPAASHSRSKPTAGRQLIAEHLRQGTRVLEGRDAWRLLACFDIPTGFTAGIQANDSMAPVADHDNQDKGTHPEGAGDQRSALPDARQTPGQTSHTPVNERLFMLTLFRDATFGPVIALRLHGDQAASLPASVQLPPLNRYLIDRLLSEPHVARWLGPLRTHPAVNVDALIHALRQLSEIACELPEVFNLTIGCLRVRDDHVVPEAVHLVIEKSANLPLHAHLAIHPYPRDWIRQTTLKDDRPMILRPVRPEDALSIQSLVRGLSIQSRYLRFMHTVSELSPLLIARFTRLDYDRQMSFVAVADEAENEIVGVSRYTMNNDRTAGEFALSIADAWQGKGLGKALLSLLISHARSRGLRCLQGTVLRENETMQHLMRTLGFVSKVDDDDVRTLNFSFDLISAALEPAEPGPAEPEPGELGPAEPGPATNHHD